MISATDAAVIERAYRLANKAMFTIALQVRRLDFFEPEDETFVFRKHADWEFLIGCNVPPRLRLPPSAASQRSSRRWFSFGSRFPD